MSPEEKLSISADIFNSNQFFASDNINIMGLPLTYPQVNYPINAMLVLLQD